ncbi:hypothetical protein [Aquirufa rosea]|uniref:PE-PGRS family protein n=1 Tax=Aquirufa rosea TaxID=2509241 RepID=A0A4Q1BX79_9BACT|nr:hypothetical protein [Aquirufa rosea]RXK46804.1 hypothetical protein ESB04_11600 [Aquirufa rosea]
MKISFRPYQHFLYLLALSFLLTACPGPAPTPNPATTESNYEDGLDRGIIENPELDEASGIVASKKNDGFLWAHNDSGDSNRLFLIDTFGKGMKQFVIQGAENRDWEDIALVSDSNGSAVVYIADFGDNLGNLDSYAIYWFNEPNVSSINNATITGVQKLTFTLPDGSRDMECLLVDQKTRDVYIVSKRETRKRLYKIAAGSFTNQAIVKAEFVQELNFSVPFSTVDKIVTAYYITAGDVSPDNTEILIKNYIECYYWKRGVNETIPQALARTPKLVPYVGNPTEYQGEAIAFAADGGGYYTLSEKGPSPVRLYFYKRK